MNLVKLVQNSGITDDEVIEFLEIAKGHLPRVKLEYDRLKAELNSFEDEKSNSVKDYHRLCNEISEMETTVNKLQLTIRESKDEQVKTRIAEDKTPEFHE